MKSIKWIVKAILLLLFFGLFYQINAENSSLDTEMDLFNTGGAVYDFSTPAQLIHTGTWYTDARMTLDGSEYQFTGGINGDFENHSNGGKNDSHSLFFSSAGTMSLTLDRVDGDIFQFYGLWLKHENFSSYDPPYVRIQYYDENNQVIESETFESNSFSGTIEPVKDLRVSKVTLYFSGLNNLWLDNLHAGDAPATLPSLTTSSSVFIANESATLMGEVTNDGGGTVTERGFVWNTSGGPTTSDGKVSSGSGTGSFSETVSNLQDGVTYFARAYAINEAGTAYGNEVSFTATGNLPDETQDFTGYQKIGGGDDRMISPDGHFILSSSDDPNLSADDFGAYLNAGGNGETGYLEFKINPDSDLGSFELQSLYLGEYNTGDPADFENNIVTGYSDDTVVAETTPYNSVGDGVIDNYPIDYSVFADKRVNRVRITFTALEGTNFFFYNLVNFTIVNSSTQEPETSNAPPTDIFLSDTSANQSESIHAVVGTLSTTDPDVGDTHTYTLASGTGDAHNDLYNINGDQLRANDAGSMAAGDYSVRIQATDNDGEIFSKAFTITIVDDIAPVAESVDVPEAGYYSVDGTLDFTVDVSENVIVNTTGGTPYIELNIGETTDYAQYSSGSGTDKIVFRYTVPEGAQDLDGITIGTQISLNGGTIRDEAGNDLEPQLNNIGDTSGIYIDAISPDAPFNLALDPDSETGFSFEDDDIRYTNITTPKITGEAEPESNVILNSSIDGEVGTAAADGDGNWSITTTALSAGEHTLTATAADLAGNSSIASDALVIMIDTSAPVVTDTTPADNAGPYDESVNFVITFSEEVYGLINDDFTLVSTGSAQGTILSLSSGSGESITAVVHNISGDGSLRLDYTGTGVADIAGNLLPVYSEGTPHQVIPKSEQTISFTEIADRTYGEGEFQLGPETTSEGLTITYTAEVAGLLNIDGNTATILNASSTKITATQEGNEEVEAADPVVQTVTINKAVLSVSVDENQNKVYGNEDPVFTMTTSGFVNDDDESVITGELDREEGENAGTYTITPGTLDGGDNYNIIYTSAEFEITPRPLAIAVQPGQSKVYGESDPGFLFEASNFGWDDNESVLNGALSRAGGENSGLYTITPGDLDAGGNYSIDFTSAEFEITLKELTINAEQGQSKVYGEADPVFTYSASGFENGDSEAVISGSLSRETGEDTGYYEISPGDLSAGNNYDISFNSTDFEIRPRPLTLSNFTASDKTYDGTADVTDSGFDDDRIEGDDLEFAYSAAFEDKNTGEGKAVNYTDIVISGGADKNNYSLAAFSASANADIKPKTINIINAIAENKVYDGTNEAVLADKGVISGLVDGETLTLAGPENVTFEDEITGNGKNVAAKGYSIEDGISGDPASNYLLDTNEITISADILKKQLSVIVRDDKKIIDDEPYTGGNGVIFFDGFVNGENENILQGSLIYGGTSQGALIPGYYTIEVSGLSSMNYDIEYVDGRLTILSIPAAEHLFPVEGSDRVSTGTDVYVEFDQEISALNLNGIQITYRNQSGQEENVEGVTGSVANNRLTISHPGLHYDTDYTVSATEGVVENAYNVGNDQFEWNFTTMISPPAKVVITDPADGEGKVSRKPGFSWHASDEAETYQIQVASDPDFTDMVIDQDDIQESAYTTDQQLDYQMLYYWRVRSFNYSGISEWSDVSEFMTIAATPVTVFPVYESENISTAPDIQWSSDHENTQYRLQLAGSDDFKEAIADTLVNEDIVRLTGLKDDQIHYWRVKVENEFTESEWSQINAFRTRVDPVNTEDQIVSVGIEFGDSAAENRRELSGLDYRLIGFPGRDAYKLNQFFEGEYGTGWRAFTDNGNNIDYYDEYTPDDNRFRFIPGKGFWVLSTDKLNFELAILNVEINERDGYDIVLQSGWNIISNPHRGTVSWADVLELNDFQADLYEYNERFVLADSLQPVQGYYIYNNPQDPLESINIPYSSMQQRRKANNNQSTLNAAMESEPSRATLQAIINGDTELKVDLIFTNQTNKAAVGEIDWRRHYPSLEMSKVGMMMIDEDIERGGLIRDEAFYSEQGREYRLKMKSEVGKPFTLSAEMSGLPGQARLLLVNPVTNQSWMMADGESVEMTVSEPEAMYRMYVGDQHWLEGHQEELLPQDIMLEQNYPNPFNPVTNIRYSIPNQQNVRLEIYDVIGRRVQVLQNGVQQPGWHLVQFDGNNLSSGVYFYRLQTNNSMKVGSMMLVK